MGFIVRAQSPYSPLAKWPQLNLAGLTQSPETQQDLDGILAMYHMAGFPVLDSGPADNYHSEWNGRFGPIPNGYHVELATVSPFDPSDFDCFPAIVLDGHTRSELSKDPVLVVAPPLPPIVRYGPF